MNKHLIYIADDEKNICNIMKSFLEKEGFSVETFYDGQAIMDAFSAKPADMLIVDIMMPVADGFSVCLAIREKSNVPIIIVSARDTDPDKIAGLTLGSDDYLTKPFSPMELVARVKSLFRRIELDRSGASVGSAIQIADISIDLPTKRAKSGERELNLTGMEFSFLYYLIQNRNRPVSRGELLDRVWGFDYEVETRATDDTVKRIRKKLSDVNSILKIETVWGFGFKLTYEESEDEEKFH